VRTKEGGGNGDERAFKIRRTALADQGKKIMVGVRLRWGWGGGGGGGGGCGLWGWGALERMEGKTTQEC